MAISPGIYNFTIYRRSDHKERFQFCDENGVPINLSAYQIKAQAWKEGRSDKVFDFVVNTTQLAQGIVSISVSKSITASIPNQFQYDVLLIDSTGFSEYYISGTITAEEGYTE